VPVCDDFMNSAPDFDITSLGEEYFAWVVRRMASSRSHEPSTPAMPTTADSLIANRPHCNDVTDRAYETNFLANAVDCLHELLTPDMPLARGRARDVDARERSFSAIGRSAPCFGPYFLSPLKLRSSAGLAPRTRALSQDLLRPCASATGSHCLDSRRGGGAPLTAGGFERRDDRPASTGFLMRTARSASSVERGEPGV